MIEMHLRQSWLTYSACETSTKKTKKELKNLNIQGIHNIFIKTKLDKTCFQHDMGYGDFKDLTRRKASDNILCDITFNIAKNSKYDEYQGGPASIVYRFFDKKTSGSAAKNENMTNQKLTEELHKPIIRKLENKNYIHLL